MSELYELRRAARVIFDDALRAVDARRAVLDSIETESARLRVCDTEFDLRARPMKIYSVATGKAAAAMASALDERLGERLAGGVLSAPPSDLKSATNLRLGARWRVFAGGHPLPDESSLEAARAAFKLLSAANDAGGIACDAASATDDAGSLVIFLVSGGGSAMLEWPRDARLTLADLRETNRLLVSCGAGITEVNAVRRALSAVKGGGLASRAPRAAQLTLIVSDVGAGRERDVASGPTLTPPPGTPAVKEIITRYKLAARLPANVLRALEEHDARTSNAGSSNVETSETERAGSLRRHYVVLDNARACEAAVESARARGFAVEFARDLDEQPVDEGAASLVARLEGLQRRAGAGRVCLISGGEFACPVRGAGIGGRNAETALRCAFEFEKIARARASEATRQEMPEETLRPMVALCAGTDGVDGNSPAAGALADTTTLARARGMNLDGLKFLEESDAYGLFRRLGDALITGPTGTNVRDLRILLRG